MPLTGLLYPMYVTSPDGTKRVRVGTEAEHREWLAKWGADAPPVLAAPEAPAPPAVSGDEAAPKVKARGWPKGKPRTPRDSAK